MVLRSSDILALLDALATERPPVDEREAMSGQRFRAALATLTDPCSEAADVTHVTSSAIVVGPRGVLLHRHKRLGIWLQPGGHIDTGEHPAEAALRETLEETGIAARHPADGPVLCHVDVHDGPRGHLHLDLRYLLEANDEDPAPPEGESQDVRWFSWDEAALIDEPGLAGIIRALDPKGVHQADTH